MRLPQNSRNARPSPDTQSFLTIVIIQFFSEVAAATAPLRHLVRFRPVSSRRTVNPLVVGSEPMKTTYATSPAPA